MIKTHNIAVDNYSITPETIDVGTKGSYGNEQLRFSFSKEWQGLLVKVSFFPPNLKPVVLLLSDGGVVDIPEEVTRNGGKTQYIVSGHADGRLIKSLIGELNVLNTLNVATTPPDSPTPTEMEQVEQWLLEAIALAQSVRDDADNGVFDGVDGETPVFSVGEVKKGEEPELTITGTILNPVLNIVLPIGNTGHTGATGDTGATFTPNVSENGIISWDNDKELPNPPERDITGPIGPAGVVIGVPPANDPLKRVWVDPDGEALINEVIDNLIEESTIARDESVEAKGITLEAKDETLEARDETVTARDDAEAFAEQTALDRTATGADRTATGEDRAAVNTALSGFATDTLPDAVQAIEDKANAEITRVGQAGDAQVQAVEQVGGEQIQAATEQADRAEREADDALDAKDAAETAQGKAEDAQGLAEGAKADAITAQGLAEDAQGSAEAAAVLAESHSKGGTASREGEDTDNALYYKGLAESAKTAAETAQGFAEAAQETAEQAADTAATDTVNAASLLLSGYVTDAQTAKADAETAQGKAEDAQEGAEAASGAAVSAHNVSPTAHADIIAAKADKLTEGNYTPGNVIMSDESGNIADSGYPVFVDVITDPIYIQNATRKGTMRYIADVGDSFEVSRGSDILTFDFIGFDADTPADTQFTHSTTVQLHDCYKALQYDAPELLFYVNPNDYPSGLVAGTYSIILDRGAYSGGTGEDGTYQFATTQSIPAGGGLRHTTAGVYRAAGAYTQANITGGKIVTYNAAGAAIESNIAVTLGAEGTNIGTFSGKQPAYRSSENCNYTERNAYGSNNYEQSAMRQWLNSGAAAGSVWTAKTIFDLAPSWAATEAGFLNGFDADFLAVLGAPVKRTARNTFTDGGGFIDISTDIMFLLSRGEVGGANEGGINQGAPYEFYDNMLINHARNDGGLTGRIKYLSGSPRLWWLRSPYTSNSNSVRIVYPLGNLNISEANNAYSVAPACCII